MEKKKAAIKKTVEKRVVKKRIPPVQFSYCIGKPWFPEDPNSSICVYSYGSAVFYGSEKDSEGMKKFIEGRDKPNKYSVYKLVKI
jgi:hypothetical protein